MSHADPIHYIYSTFMAVVVCLFGTPSLSGSSLWHWGPCCLTNKLPPTALSPSRAHCCCVMNWACITVLGPELLLCSHAGYLPAAFPWGHSHLLLNSLLVVHQGSNSIIIGGGLVGYILAVLRDQMFPSSTVRRLPVFPFSIKNR